MSGLMLYYATNCNEFNGTFIKYVPDGVYREDREDRLMCTFRSSMASGGGMRESTYPWSSFRESKVLHAR